MLFSEKYSYLPQDALYFAACAHKDQKRKYNDELYIMHPIRVASYISNDLFPSLVKAALLHDTIEDCGVTKEQLSVYFGDTVASLVEELTHPKYPELNRAQRAYKEFERLKTISPYAKLIKLYDIQDNISDISKLNKEFAPVYLKEKQMHIEALKTPTYNLRYLIVKGIIDKELAALSQ